MQKEPLFMRKLLSETYRPLTSNTDTTSEEFSVRKSQHNHIRSRKAPHGQDCGVCASMCSVCGGDAYRCSSRGDGEIIRLIGNWKSAAAAKTSTQTGGQLSKQKWKDPYLLQTVCKHTHIHTDRSVIY